MEAQEKNADDKANPQADVAVLTHRGNHPSPSPASGKKHKRLGLVLKGRYRIESLIASGGMSDVYKAADRHLEEAGARDCMVAVKILRSELTQDANALSLLAREAAKSKRLSHPNIIRVHDLDHDGDTWFMVMELLDGEPLSRIIQRAKPRGLKWKGGRAVLQQVASALAFSHRRGIVHADLKPSNIFFTREGEIKLLDFGVAQALKPAQHIDFLNPNHDDETTIYGYTPAYASPALIAGKDPTVRDDLYALGCISYELLSSRHPFDRKKLTKDELSSYRLKKPKNMPRPLWRAVRSLLRNNAASTDLPGFQAAMQPIEWSRYLYPAGLAIAVFMAAGAWHQGYHENQLATAQIETYQSRAALLEELSGSPPGTLLAALNDLEPLEKAGLLKLQQERILDHFRDRTDEALLAPGRPNLPNVPAALETVAEARVLYPRDRHLIDQYERLSQRGLSLKSAISEELQGRLAQGDYRDFESLDELTNLAADLRFLGNKLPGPSDAAAEKYAEQLAKALEDDDGPALARLLEVGQLFFTNRPELEVQLAEARQLEGAIAELGHYHQAVAAGEEPGYPVSAAEKFYSRRLESWQDGIDNASNSAGLDAVYADLTRLQENVPSGFAPFASLRQRLADAYVSQADALLSRGRSRQAQPLLQKAAALMRSTGT